MEKSAVKTPPLLTLALTLGTILILVKSEIIGNANATTESPEPQETLSAPSETVELYRYWNAGIWDHFYTTNWTELGDGKDGYIYEGLAGRVFPSPVKGTLPLFRYWQREKKDHFYTTNWAELMGRFTSFYGSHDYEGISCYIFPSPVEGTKPFHRYYNWGNVDHFFTTNWEELRGGKDGYYSEGIAGYVF